MNYESSNLCFMPYSTYTTLDSRKVYHISNKTNTATVFVVNTWNTVWWKYSLCILISPQSSDLVESFIIWTASYSQTKTLVIISYISTPCHVIYCFTIDDHFRSSCRFRCLVSQEIVWISYYKRKQKIWCTSRI